MTRVLVTGGNGFLGRHVVRRLLARGDQVRVFGRRIPDDAPREVDQVAGDVRDADAVSRVVSGVDAVIHLVSNFRSAKSDRKDAHAVNVGGTQNVLDAARRHGVRRFLHCSTIGVHGDVREIPATEDTPFNPGDAYQRTKLEAERLLAESNGVPVTVLRPISMFGPGDTRMLKLFRMIRSGWFVRAGSGESLFQPAYVDDVADAFALCLDHPRAPGGTFIVGGEEYVTLNELARIIAEELGVKLRVLPVPLKPLWAAAAACEWMCAPFGIEPPLHRRRVSFYRNSRAFSVARAREVLGFAPKVSLREGVRRTVAWYREHGWL